MEMLEAVITILVTISVTMTAMLGLEDIREKWWYRWLLSQILLAAILASAVQLILLAGTNGLEIFRPLSEGGSPVAILYQIIITLATFAKIALDLAYC